MTNCDGDQSPASGQQGETDAQARARILADLTQRAIYCAQPREYGDPSPCNHFWNDMGLNEQRRTGDNARDLYILNIMAFLMANCRMMDIQHRVPGAAEKNVVIRGNWGWQPGTFLPYRIVPNISVMTRDGNNPTVISDPGVIPSLGGATMNIRHTDGTMPGDWDLSPPGGDTPGGDTPGQGTRPPGSINAPHIVNSWHASNIAPGGERWFRFTARSGGEVFIHLSRPGVKLTLGEGNEEGIYNLQRSVQGASCRGDQTG